MGKKLTPEERAARAERRAARSDRQVARKVNDIAMRELKNRIAHDQGFGLDAEGFAAKHATAIGTPNPVTPLDQNENHDPTATTN